MLIHVDCSDTSTCSCLFPAPIPHSRPKKKSHTCVNFSKRCLDNKALPGTCETAPSPRCHVHQVGRIQLEITPESQNIMGFFREHDTMIHEIIRLQASTGGGVGTGVTSFNASANQKQIGRKQPVAQRGPKPWYTNMSLMFQADVPWMYPYYLANLDDPCVHVAGFTPQTATFHSSLQLGKHSSETSQEPLCHAILRIQPPHASKPLPKVQSTSESM